MKCVGVQKVGTSGGVEWYCQFLLYINLFCSKLKMISNNYRLMFSSLCHRSLSIIAVAPRSKFSTCIDDLSILTSITHKDSVMHLIIIKTRY